MNLLKWTFILLLLGSLNTITFSQTICHPDDLSALMRLRDATNGGGGIGSWNTIANLPNGINSRWDGVAANVWQWHGIDTLHDATFPTYFRVSKINLDGTNFTGVNRLENNLPDSLFYNASLEHVDSLSLNNNALTGTTGLLKPSTSAPANHALRFLDLSDNDFNNTNADIFVHLLSNFDNLLTAHMNDMMGTAPTAFTFFNLPTQNSLQEVQLNLNNFTDSLVLEPLLSVTWSSLQVLAMGGNALTSIYVPTGTVSGGVLTDLIVPNNDVQNFQEIANCLEHLALLKHFGGQSVMDETVGATLVVHNFAVGLEHIDLSNNGLTGPLPVAFFEDISNINTLDLSNNAITGVLPKPRNAFSSGTFSGLFAYQGLANLDHLDLSNNNFKDFLRLDWLLLDQLDNNVANNGLNAPIKTLDVSKNSFSNVTPHLAAAHSTFVLGQLSDRFENLTNLNVDDNSLDFIDLFRIKRFFRLRQITILTQKHYVPQSGTTPSDFAYSPQDSIGIGGIKRRNVGDTLVIEAGRGVIEAEQNTVNVLKNKYTWERRSPIGPLVHIGNVNPNGTFTAGPGVHSSFAGALGLLNDSTHSHKLGIYNLDDNVHHEEHFTACVTNDSFPMLTLCLKHKKIEVGPCLDSVGNPIQCQTVVVQFHPDTLAQYTAAEQDSLKAASSEAIGATPIATCVCGDLELWEISDTASTMLNAFGTGTRTASTVTAAKPELLSAEPNYALISGSNYTLPDTVALPSGSGNTHSTTLVAIIDAGIDYQYSALVPYISEGSSINTSCMQNAVWGYNFLDETNNASDDHGHGTAIAGIVAGLSKQNLLPDTGSIANSIGILPLKYTDKTGAGTVFNAACAMHYAADYERSTSSGGTAKVRVINNSWGYYGEPSDILEYTIKYVGNNCGILVVNSAGNDGIFVGSYDSLQHWPSNSIHDPMDTIDIDNILSVAAVDHHNANTLASYSNYSNTYIDIAAQGTDSTTLAGSTNGFAEFNGTSFAAAQVSRAAALLFDKYPDATYFAVKYALLNSVDVLQSNDSSQIASKGRLNFERADSLLNVIIDRTICNPYYGTVDIKQVEDINAYVKVYPNPTTQHINLEIDPSLTRQEVQVSLYNTQGQRLQYQTLAPSSYQHQLSIENLPKGIYWIQLQLRNQQISKKIIKL